MGITMMQQTQQHSAFLAAQDAALSTEDLWLHYYSVGGNLKAFELGAYLHGMYPLPVGERNTIALALNELVDDLPGCRKAEFVYDVEQD